MKGYILSTLALFLCLVLPSLFQDLHIDAGVFGFEFFPWLHSICGVVFYIDDSCLYFPQNIRNKFIEWLVDILSI